MALVPVQFYSEQACIAVQLQANVSFRTGCVYYWRWPNYKWPTLYTLLQISRPGSWCIEHLSALAPFWTTAPGDLAQRWCVNRGKNPCWASCSMATWQLPCKQDHGRTFKCCEWIVTIMLSWMNTRPLDEITNQGPPGVCACKKITQHICTLYILLSMSEFSGVWKHQNNPGCAKSAGIFKTLKLDTMHK